MATMTNDHNKIVVIAWAITATTVLLAFTAWGQSQRWHLIGLSTYRIFPLLGLVAFSLLWSQYMMIAFQKYWQIKPTVLKSYFHVWGWLALVAILMHPSLLVWQLWRDGFGLPPESYIRHFVPPGMGWIAILGTISFGIFLTYELHRWLGRYSWWRYVSYASDVALVTIFYHGLRLGDQLQGGWFRVVWLVYGVCLIMVLAYLRFAWVWQKTKTTARPRI